jgi:hypothetical protein
MTPMPPLFVAFFFAIFHAFGYGLHTIRSDPRERGHVGRAGFRYLLRPAVRRDRRGCGVGRTGGVTQWTHLRPGGTAWAAGRRQVPCTIILT